MDNQTGTLFALCGFIGSGKTTFAKKLEREHRCFRLNTDEMMVRLFGINPPADKFEEWHTAVMQLQLDYAVRLLQIGTNVVIDLGLWQRAARDEIKQLAANVGAPLKLYYIYAPDSVMHARAVNRQTENGETLLIDTEIWNKLRHKFNPPDANEGFELIDNSKDWDH